MSLSKRTRSAGKKHRTERGTDRPSRLCNYLQLRELGVRTPQSLLAPVLRRRVETMRACQNIEMRRSFRAAITTLDIESIDYRYLLSGSLHGNIGLHDLRINDKIQTGLVRSKAISQSGAANSHGRAVTRVSWYPFDTGMFISSSFDGKIKVWDTNELKPVTEFNIQNRIYTHAMSSVSTQPLIAAATESTQVHLCDLRTGDYIHSLTGHKKSVMSVEWSPTSEYLLVSGGQDGRILCWDVRKSNAFLCSLDQYNTDISRITPTNRAHQFAVNGLAFTANGQHLISTGHDERIRLWNLCTFRNEIVNYGNLLRNQANRVVTPCIVQEMSGQSPVLFHASDDRHILQYDLFSGRLIKQFDKSHGRIYDLTWRSFYQELLAGGEDYDIQMWSPMMSRTTLDRANRNDDELLSKRRRITEDISEAEAEEVSSDAWSDEDEDDDIKIYKIE
ncbi:WD40-repeat-containing domain protein [Syncephalis plumigaleata]|nr:WD40-repeat-containing domain protein [Syncephalis plumigaleata]